METSNKRSKRASAKGKDYSHALKLASKQRLTALKNAFKTVDSFIVPSGTPDIWQSYDKVKKYLLKMYSDKKNFPK